MAYDLTKAASLRVVKKLAEKVKEIQDKLKELQDKSSTVYWYLTSTTVSESAVDSTMGYNNGEKYYTSSLTKEQFISAAESGKKISLILDNEQYGEVSVDISRGSSVADICVYATCSEFSSTNNQFFGYNSYTTDCVFAFPYYPSTDYSSSNTVSMKTAYIPFMQKSGDNIKLSNRQIPIGTGLKLRDYKDIVIDDDYLKDYLDGKVGDGLGIMDDGTVGLTSIVKNAVLENEVVIDIGDAITIPRLDNSDDNKYPLCVSRYVQKIVPVNWDEVSKYLDERDRTIPSNLILEFCINGENKIIRADMSMPKKDYTYILSTKNGSVSEYLFFSPDRGDIHFAYFTDSTADSIVISDFKIIVYNSNGEKIPAYTSADEGKALKIVNGKPAWVSDAPEVLE